MGSGSKTAHAAYATEPTAPQTHPAEAADQPLAAGPSTDAAPALGEVLADLDTAVAALQEFSSGPAHFADTIESSEDEAGTWYAALQAQMLTAHHLLHKAELAGLPEPLAQSYAQQLREASGEAMSALDPGQLQQLAATQGFTAPELVGLNHAEGEGTHPLAHWLDPFYPMTPSKEKIQAKAVERLEALCTGTPVAGVALAEVTVPTGAGGTWSATPESVEALASTLADRVSGFHAIPYGDHHALGQALTDIVAVESLIATAGVDPAAVAPGDLQDTKLVAKSQVNSVLNSLAPNAAVLDPLLDDAVQKGLLSQDQRHVLSSHAALALVRASSELGEKTAVAALAQKRIEQAQAVNAAWKGVQGYLGDEHSQLNLGPDFDAADPATYAQPIADLANHAALYAQHDTEVSKWVLKTKAGYEQVTGVPVLAFQQVELATTFQAWTVGKSTKGLQLAAEQVGMQDASHATKAQAKKYITAQWSQLHDVDAIQASVTAKAHGASPLPPPKPAAPASGGKTPATVAGFAAKNKQLVAALEQHHALAAGIPQHIDTAVVAAHDFGAGTSAAGLGGVHTKSVHTGPDGGKWMFKPDKTGGARAHAEAAASRVYAALGLPAVPVYTATVGGKTGCVQPLVSKAVQLDPSPSSWSQGDVDALVRTHVATWLIGDHDNKPDNILKTPSGGLVPVDAGQAFKHWGTDSLSSSFSPNAGGPYLPPAAHMAYSAAAKGALAPGVVIKPAVAHPVIAKVEKIPDTQWRAMLHQVAYEGAITTAISWVPAMRDRAAKTHGIDPAKVSHSQIAEAFLDHACERKANLRSSFVKFFTSVGVDGSVLTHGAG